MRDDAERKVELAAAKNREAKLLRKTAYVIAQEAGRLPFAPPTAPPSAPPS